MLALLNELRAGGLFQIPNPLFDRAGITCGHFLVPFGSFFGATLIGKAIIKMHIQVVGSLLMLLLFVRACLSSACSVLPSAAPAVCQLPSAVSIPHHRRSMFGCRTFSVAGPMTLPNIVRDPTCSFDSLRRELKTFLFLVCSHTQCIRGCAIMHCINSRPQYYSNPCPHAAV